MTEILVIIIVPPVKLFINDSLVWLFGPDKQLIIEIAVLISS